MQAHLGFVLVLVGPLIGSPLQRAQAASIWLATEPGPDNLLMLAGLALMVFVALHRK